MKVEITSFGSGKVFKTARQLLVDSHSFAFASHFLV